MNYKTYPTQEVLGYNVFSSKLTIIDPQIEKLLINTFSPNSYGLAAKDKRFETALKNSDILVLDGIGVAFGSIILNGKNIKKISGQDCFDYFIALSNKKNWKVFFLGSTIQTLERIQRKLFIEYPFVNSAFYSPPFKDEFSLDDNSTIRQCINSFSPDILFVGLTAPKQEKWAYENKDLINARIIVTIGNVFDWYAGNSKRPGKFWIKLRLEWLVRIILRPEIFKRNTKNQLRFLRDLFLHIKFLKKNKE